jgi:hypothetical protein
VSRDSSFGPAPTSADISASHGSRRRRQSALDRKTVLTRVLIAASTWRQCDEKASADVRASPLSLPGLPADDHSGGEFRRHRRGMGGRGPAHLGHDGNDRGLPGGRGHQRALIARRPQEAARTPRNGYARPQRWLLCARGVAGRSEPLALGGETSEALPQQRPLPDDTLWIVAKGKIQDGRCRRVICGLREADVGVGGEQPSAMTANSVFRPYNLRLPSL